MLTSTVLVLLMTISGPRIVLWRPRPLQEHALGPDAGVLHGLHRRRPLGALRLQHRLHRRLRLLRRLLESLPVRRDAGLQSGHLQRRRQHLRTRLRLLPDDLCGHHPGAHRRRLRRTHEVFGGGAVHPAVGHADLFPDRAHGLVLGRHRTRSRMRSRRLRRPAATRRRRPRRKRSLRPSTPTPAGSSRRARSISPAAPSCISMPASPASSAP